MRVGELLTPMVVVMRRELVGSSYIQADETPVDVQMHHGRGQNHQAYLWQYSRPGGSAVFDFRLGRGRHGPKQFLGPFEGILQSDGYTAYEHVGGPKMVHAARHALRLEQARPLLDIIHQEIERARAHALPSRALGNLAENSMRPVALGRKNWIHIGSPQAGPKVAAILSIVESCRRLKIPVRDYLAAVLPGLAGTSIQKLAELTPTAWAAKNQ